MVHLISVHTKTRVSRLSWIYQRKIMHLHGLPSSIMSDHDSKFVSRWWHELHKIVGTRLLMSTSYHLQTDGQMKHVNCNVGQIFHMVVQSDQRNWINLTEFAINTSVSETIWYASCKLNGGYMPSMIWKIWSNDVIPKGIRDFADRALQNLANMHDTIRQTCMTQLLRQAYFRLARWTDIMALSSR